ncbi:MAG: MmgE/PrpD family protein [Candidatus Tectomicrobia bacterium]|uniref:MmgE/PrpD family protein n=1 Tax=Tectimicrobiota bacterium TaxID=2528274 RepID=A0A932MQ24_UNCTE|nr:MmgE/PrpD family protein [Candidatus Tectomicrobia bacterium]
MTMAEDLAAFASSVSCEGMSEAARKQVKLLVLDALGCAIGSLGAEPIEHLRKHAEEFGGAPLSTLIGGGQTAPDRAAFYNTALVRDLDFNDSYMGKKGTVHPSDNLGAVLAAAEYAGASGTDFIPALALAYQVQCRLADVAGSEARGFDQGVAGAYGSAAGAARALGLHAKRAAHAIAIAGASNNPLFVTRTGHISHWKGFAMAAAGMNAAHAAFLAMRGVTGPLAVFEGTGGMMEAVSGPFEIDWSREKLDRVLGVAIKKYNAGVHSQTALEAALELREKHGFKGEEIEAVEVGLYERAYNIMGGGKYGGKHDIRNKETADHSLPYVLAAALLDGQLLPAQYAPARIAAPDVQALLRKVKVVLAEDLTARYPAHSCARVKITLKDGRSFADEHEDYEGFPTRPMRWETVAAKFHALAAPRAPEPLRRDIEEACARLDSIRVRDLTALLGRVGRG